MLTLTDLINNVLRRNKRSRTIVFDLEGVLIDTVYRGNTHPEAIKVLELARDDFDMVYLWTNADEQQSRSALKLLEIEWGFNLYRYFDRIMYHESPETRQAWLLGKPKYLAILGNPEDFVLIEDNDSAKIIVGYPNERVIRIPSYYGQECHDLLKQYKRALLLLPADDKGSGKNAHGLFDLFIPVQRYLGDMLREMRNRREI